MNQWNACVLTTEQARPGSDQSYLSVEDLIYLNTSVYKHLDMLLTQYLMSSSLILNFINQVWQYEVLIGWVSYQFR